LIGMASSAGKPKPGFIVCDILLGHKQTAAGLLPFIRKCETVRSLKRVGKCLSIFVAESYSPSAFQAARSKGIVPATPESLFGEELASAFIELTKVLKQAAFVSVDPEKFDWLFRQLGKIEGAAQSLRGALFEFVVADLVRKLWGAQVTLNYKFREAGRDVAEVDVLALLVGRSLHFIECKGHAPHQTVDDSEVEEWLTERIPAIRKKALEHPDWKNLELHFELWTSGQLSEASAARVAKIQSSVPSRKYTVRWRPGEEIGNLAKSLHDDALRRVLRTHFLEHPLAAEGFQTATPATSSLMVARAAAGTEEWKFENLSLPSLPSSG
jgi:hypothetical protein